MKIPDQPTNVLGMKLSIPHHYIETQRFTREVHAQAEVIKVQRSGSGFKTSTGTTRSCERCRGERAGEKSDEWNGARPWPMATWLLLAITYDRSFQLALCNDHFTEIREKRDQVPEVPFHHNHGEWASGYKGWTHGVSEEGPPPSGPWESLDNPPGRA